MLPAKSGICRKSRSSNPYAHTAARVGSSQRSRLSGLLLIADHCGVGDPTHFDIPHRRLTEEALVLPVELARALIAHFERRPGGIDPFNEHSFSCGNQSKLFLVLKWAHRRQRAEVMRKG